MSQFIYEALDATGKEITDIVEAEDKTDAIKQIRDKGFFPTKVREIVEKKSQDATIESIFNMETKQSYIEYLSGLLGNKLIAWGQALKGTK